MWDDRTILLLGEEKYNRLKNSHVTIVGLGGVGGYAATLLARAGVENLKIVDFDTVDESNINRQIVANIHTVGRPKAEVLKEQILQINPNCKVEAICERISGQNIGKIISNTDYVVDAIDQIQDKIDLICHCKHIGINIVSAMGAGNRISVPQFDVMDIFKTSHDGLAKVIRKKLRENGIESLDVVACKSPALQIDDGAQTLGKRLVGSISYFPAMCGCVLAAYVVCKICENA